MAENTFSYKIVNDREFQASINDAIKKVGSLKSPFKLISRDFYKSEMAIFRLTGPGEYPDFKNKKSKKAKKRRAGFEYPLLMGETKKLMKSVTSPSAEGSVNIITDTQLTIGTSIEYGIYHQSDSPGKGIIPQRKFLFIGPEGDVKKVPRITGRLERWTSIIKEHVDKKLGIIK